MRDFARRAMVTPNHLQAQRCSTSGSGSSLPAGRCLHVLPRCCSSVLPFFPLFHSKQPKYEPLPIRISDISHRYVLQMTARTQPRQDRERRVSCSEALFIQTLCCSPIPQVHAVLWKGHYVSLSTPSCRTRNF